LSHDRSFPTFPVVLQINIMGLFSSFMSGVPIISFGRVNRHHPARVIERVIIENKNASYFQGNLQKGSDAYAFVVNWQKISTNRWISKSTKAPPNLSDMAMYKDILYPILART